VIIEAKLNLGATYIPSENVPLKSGIGDMEEELFTLNETGRAIWDRLDGKKNLKEIVAELRNEFEDAAGEIEQDVAGLTAELLNRKRYKNP